MGPLVSALIALTAAQNVLFAAAVGALACSVLEKRAGMGALIASRGPRAGLAGALALTALAVLWLQAAVMSGLPLAGAGAALGAVLTQSHYGIAWLVGFAGALLAASGSLGARGGLPVFAVGLLAWAVGKAMTSHAADAGDFSAGELIHVVHLGATALWAGSVMVAAVALKSARAARVTNRVTANQQAAFCHARSNLAAITLVIVLVTGFYNVAQDTAQSHTPRPDTVWGHLLGLKLIGVAVAAALGGWNRLMVLPDLRTRAQQDSPDFNTAQSRFTAWLLAEASVMLVILVIGAVLGHMSATGD